MLPDSSRQHTLRSGVRIAIDVGKVRVGIAASDSEGILATPVATASRGKNDLAIVLRLAREKQILEIYVGYPLNMDGTVGSSAKAALAWARRIQRKLPDISVRMIDERLTSVLAHRQLHEAGRAEITHRAVVDQVAAVNILESALETERTSGRVPGISLTELLSPIGVEHD